MVSVGADGESRCSQPAVPEHCFCVIYVFGNAELRARTAQTEPPLTNVGGHRPVHDVECLVEFVLDGWVCQHLVREHGLPAQVPLGDLFIIWAVAEPGAQHLSKRNKRNLHPQWQQMGSKLLKRPWLVWLSGLSGSLRTKGLPVQFLVRADAWVVGQVPSWGHVRGNQSYMDVSLPLSPSLPLFLKINLKILKKNKTVQLLWKTIFRRQSGSYSNNYKREVTRPWLGSSVG